jgi:hypothetical protein
MCKQGVRIRCFAKVWNQNWGVTEIRVLRAAPSNTQIVEVGTGKLVYRLILSVNREV